MKRHSPPAGLHSPQHYWAVMRRLTAESGSFTIREVWGLSNGVALRTVKSYVLFCAAAGHVVLTGVGVSRRNREVHSFRVANLRAEAPVERRAGFADDRGRRAQQLWTAMRGLRSFSALELAVAASTEDLAIGEKRAREFIAALARAGWVAEIGERGRVGQRAFWRLLPQHSTGPKPPAVTAAGVVDRNLSRPLVIPAVNLNERQRRGRAA